MCDCTREMTRLIDARYISGQDCEVDCIGCSAARFVSWTCDSRLCFELRNGLSDLHRISKHPFVCLFPGLRGSMGANARLLEIVDQFC